MLDIVTASVDDLWELWPNFVNLEQLRNRLNEVLSRLPSSGALVWECWHWGGKIDAAGYARFGGGTLFGTVYVSRIVWQIVHRQALNRQLDVDHLCHNRACVNPFHLEAVTRKVNLERRRKKEPKTVCPHGHVKRQQPNGTWYCPTCLKAAQLRWLAKDGNREKQNAARNARRKREQALW